jgi:sugar phosphate permease
MGKKKLFWGWYVVIGTFLILAINYGIRYSFGIFLKPMSEDYGWTRSVISIAASINMLVYSIGSLFLGRMVDKIAPRWIMTAGAMLTALSLVLTAFVTSPLAFYLVYGLLCGAGASGMGVVVGNSSVGKWFIRKRGMAIGITTMGISFGTMALAPLSGYITKHYSWQTGFLILGAITLIVGVTLPQLFLKKTHPEAYGLSPDGDDQLNWVPEDLANGNRPENISRRVALRDPRLLVLAGSFSLAIMVLMSVVVHQVAYALDHGIDRIAAASSVGVVSLAGFAGQFFFGWLSDRISDPKHSACLGFCFMAAGMGILLKAETPPMLFLYALVFGFGYGSLAPMMPILVADRFGRHVLGTIYGLLTMLIGIGGSIGPLLGGLIYDRLGSYAVMWQFNLWILIGVAVFILTLKPAEGRVYKAS